MTEESPFIRIRGSASPEDIARRRDEFKKRFYTQNLDLVDGSKDYDISDGVRSKLNTIISLLKKIVKILSSQSSQSANNNNK